MCFRKIDDSVKDMRVVISKRLGKMCIGDIVRIVFPKYDNISLILIPPKF